jgi:hypothetical protein
MLSAPFQCDNCWYANIHKVKGNDWYPDVARQLAYICRVNLDIVWSLEPVMVVSTLNTLKKAKQCSEAIGLEPIDINIGP